jgi:hypothetical protein
VSMDSSAQDAGKTRVRRGQDASEKSASVPDVHRDRRERNAVSTSEMRRPCTRSRAHKSRGGASHYLKEMWAVELSASFVTLREGLDVRCLHGPRQAAGRVQTVCAPFPKAAQWWEAEHRGGKRMREK